MITIAQNCKEITHLTSVTYRICTLKEQGLLRKTIVWQLSNLPADEKLAATGEIFAFGLLSYTIVQTWQLIYVINYKLPRQHA